MGQKFDHQLLRYAQEHVRREVSYVWRIGQIKYPSDNDTQYSYPSLLRISDMTTYHITS